MTDLTNFLYPHRYYGQVKPKNLVFNANLQEFAQKDKLSVESEILWSNPPLHPTQIELTNSIIDSTAGE